MPPRGKEDEVRSRKIIQTTVKFVLCEKRFIKKDKKEIKNREKGRKMEDDVEGTWKRVPATRDRIVGKPSIASEK